MNMYDLEKQTKPKRKICLSELSVIMPAAAGIMLFILLVYLFMTANIQIMKSRADDDFFVVHHVKSYEVQKEDTPVGVIKEYTFTLQKELKKIYPLPSIQSISMWKST